MATSSIVVPLDKEHGTVEEEDARPRLSTWQLLQQFSVQLAYPFSVLPAALLFSPGFALNLMGLGSPVKAWGLLPALTFALLSACPLVVIVAFALSAQNPSPWELATLRSDALHVIVAFVSQRLTISIKYAFLPRAAYLRRLARWTPTLELRAEQLVTGWFRIHGAIIAREVELAAARCSGAASGAFSLPPGAVLRLAAVLRSREARAALEAAALEQGAGGTAPQRIPVAAMANALLLEAVSRERAYTGVLEGLLFLSPLWAPSPPPSPAPRWARRSWATTRWNVASSWATGSPTAS